ncbi:MAG: flagellar export protein FliJ [Deltaproteobacteria bacterium]|jgi:flagellar FliJ protein|nr:flagellar export protein FliJ [Deltaproteobacteria bacterium]
MYQFKLESLLNHRRYQEEVLQKTLADLKKHLQAEQHQLRNLKKKKRRNVQLLSAMQRKGRPASELKLYVDFIDHLTAELTAQAKRVMEAQRRFDATHRELMVAMKKRKILEKLKAKGRRAYEQTQFKKERALLDDVAGHQYILKS